MHITVSILFSQVNHAVTQVIGQNTKNSNGHIKLERDRTYTLRTNRSGLESTPIFLYVLGQITSFL